MKKSYQIADLSIGGNVIHVTASVEDDGGLTIYDLSYGPAADAFFGEGQDVEVWLEIPPDAARQLSRHLIGDSVENPVDEVARLLASLYKDDSHALRKIEAILDKNEIHYERRCW